MHQRQRPRDGRLLRPGHATARRPAPRRAARRRRLELRGRERRDRVLVRDHDQRPRGPAGVRACDRRRGRRHRGAPSWRGLPARARAVASQVHGRGDRSRLHPVLVPDLVALRRAARARVPARRRRRAGRQGGRGGRPRAAQARRGRPMGARAHLPGHGVRDDGRRRRQPQPLEHAARDAGPALGRSGAHTDTAREERRHGERTDHPGPGVLARRVGVGRGRRAAARRRPRRHRHHAARARVEGRRPFRGHVRGPRRRDRRRPPRGRRPRVLALHSATGFSGYAASDVVPERIAAIVYVDTAPGKGALDPGFEGDEKPMVWDEIKAEENLDGLVRGAARHVPRARRAGARPACSAKATRSRTTPATTSRRRSSRRASAPRTTRSTRRSIPTGRSSPGSASCAT